MDVVPCRTSTLEFWVFQDLTLLYTGARMRVCVTERKQTLKTNLHEVKKGFAKLRSLI